MEGRQAGRDCSDFSITHRFFSFKGRTHLSTFLASALSFLLIMSSLLFAGCGKKGPPLPRDLVTPEGIKNFSVEGRTEGFLITWQNPEKNSDGTVLTDLAGYKLHRRQNSDSCPSCPSDFPVYMDVDLKPSGDVSMEGGYTYLLDRNVKEGLEYEYGIAPYNRRGYFGPLSERKGGKWHKPLSAIKDFSAEAGDRTVNLSWQAYDFTAGGTFAGYRIYRREASGSYGREPVSPSPLEETHYTDIGLENNKQYFYLVMPLSRVGNTVIEGERSEEIFATPREMMSPKSHEMSAP